MSEGFIRLFDGKNNKKIYLSTDNSQDSLRELIPSLRREAKMDDFELINPLVVGRGSGKDPQKDKTIRISMHKPDNLGARAINIIIGKELCKENRWIHGDRMLVSFSKSDPRIMRLERGANGQPGTYCLSSNGKATPTIRLKYRSPLIPIDGLKKCEIIEKNNNAIVFKILTE